MIEEDTEEEEERASVLGQLASSWLDLGHLRLKAQSTLGTPNQLRGATSCDYFLG